MRGSLHVFEQLMEEARSLKHHFPLFRGTAGSGEVLHLFLADVEDEKYSLHK